MSKYLAIAIVTLIHTATATTAAEKPNIIYIMLDEWGYFEWSAMGHPILETPNIDRMASEGMRFTQMLAGANVCAPTRSVLMTGLHGGHTPIRRNGGGASLEPGDVTVAEVLKQAGYATGGYGKWGLGVEGSPGHPLEQGFDEFVGYLHQVHGHFFYPFWLTDGHGKLMLAEFDHSNTLKPTFPLDPTQERLSMWLLIKYGMPWLYWNRILRGKS